MKAYFFTLTFLISFNCFADEVCVVKNIDSKIKEIDCSEGSTFSLPVSWERKTIAQTVLEAEAAGWEIKTMTQARSEYTLVFKK